MFRHRRQLHRWAGRVLALWLVGVASCMTNASLAASLAALDGQQPEAAVAVEALHYDMASHGSGPHHGAPDAQPEATLGHDGPPGKVNCGDCCDESSVSMPKLKSALDDFRGHVLASSSVAIACPATVAAPGPLLLPRRDGGLAPPIPIAFLRLTL